MNHSQMVGIYIGVYGIESHRNPVDFKESFQFRQQCCGTAQVELMLQLADDKRPGCVRHQRRVDDSREDSTGLYSSYSL